VQGSGGGVTPHILNINTS